MQLRTINMDLLMSLVTPQVIHSNNVLKDLALNYLISLWLPRMQTLYPPKIISHAHCSFHSFILLTHILIPNGYPSHKGSTRRTVPIRVLTTVCTQRYLLTLPRMVINEDESGRENVCQHFPNGVTWTSEYEFSQSHMQLSYKHKFGSICVDPYQSLPWTTSLTTVDRTPRTPVAIQPIPGLLLEPDLARSSGASFRTCIEQQIGGRPNPPPSVANF